MCSDAQATTDFYRDELGFTLVKKTVNFDDPHSYHLYFGDETGSPGSLMTFFEWPRAERGRLGRGTLESIGLVTPARERGDGGRRIPTGCACGSTRASGPRCTTSSRIGNPDLYAGLVDEDAPITFAAAGRRDGADRRGHHAPHRVADGRRRRAGGLARAAAASSACGRRAQQERKYFRSIYFRMPDGILLEIATDGPGFFVDEAPTRLGQMLALPPWLEPERETLERELAPIT